MPPGLDRIGTSAPGDDLDALMPNAPNGPCPISGTPVTDAQALRSSQHYENFPAGSTPEEEV